MSLWFGWLLRCWSGTMAALFIVAVGVFSAIYCLVFVFVNEFVKCEYLRGQSV